MRTPAPLRHPEQQGAIGTTENSQYFTLNWEGDVTQIPPVALNRAHLCDPESLQLTGSGMRGIVLGSGRRTEFWRGLGWMTLDSMPGYHPDLVCHVIDMARYLQPHSLDYVFLEYLPLLVHGGKGIAPAFAIICECLKVLRPGGQIIIATGTKPTNHGMLGWKNCARMLSVLGMEYTTAIVQGQAAYIEGSIPAIRSQRTAS